MRRTKRDLYSKMGAPLLQRPTLLSFWTTILLVVGLCQCEAKSVEVVGVGECVDCVKNNIKSSHAFSGLSVAIDCKVSNGDFKTRAIGQLDEEGKFKVNLPSEIVKEDGSLKEECYAQLHSASSAPCPSHNSLESSKIIFKARDNEKHTFGPTGKLAFSPVTCTSEFLWPHFKFPPLHKKKPFFKKLPKHTFPFPLIPKVFPPKFKKPFPPPIPFFKKPLPPPIPFFKKPLPPPIPFFKKPLPPPVPIYKKPLPPPIPFFKKPLPPPVPIYKKPLPPPVPIYKKPLPPPVPIYKKPLPPPVPVYKKPLPPPVPIYQKPLPPPVPVYKKPLPPPVPIVKKPPIYKPPVYEKPLPPPVPVFKKPIPPPLPIYKPEPPIFKKPLPPLPKLPPFPKLPPKPKLPFLKKPPCPPLPKLPSWPKFPPKVFPHPIIKKLPALPPFPSHP